MDAIETRMKDGALTSVVKDAGASEQSVTKLVLKGD